MSVSCMNLLTQTNETVEVSGVVWCVAGQAVGRQGDSARAVVSVTVSEPAALQPPPNPPPAGCGCRCAACAPSVWSRPLGLPLRLWLR